MTIVMPILVPRNKRQEEIAVESFPKLRSRRDRVISCAIYVNSKKTHSYKCFEDDEWNKRVSPSGVS